MRLPDLLATRRGRLLAFFLLYVTEGIPIGFTATAVAAQMRRQGVGPAEIGVFVGTLYLPWAWKWLMGPFVDVIHSDRLGRRRAWIVAAQMLMAFTLLGTVGIDFTANLKLFTILIFIVNAFGATQDVAIDALACETLSEHERGTANGLMFAGAYCGQAVGGSGALFLAAAILTVTIFVALPLRETRPDAPVAREGPWAGAVLREIGGYARHAVRAFFGHRGATVAVVFAVLPCGAYALGLALQSNLAVELGLSDSGIGTLALASTIISAVGCVLGGFLSDRLGRRRMLATYVVLASVPTLIFALLMQRAGWIMPVDPTLPDRPAVPPSLVTAFWVVCLVFSFFHGLMYGTRTALFMDVCAKGVAATQFTAYMSLLNLVIWYTASWQGIAIERWGYPVTLLIDGLAGLVCLGLLPW
ncbi:MAG: MFS transporter, partial [Phycisphaerales bacterium]|nr:MFS transporter [Phycisphaerales bacterium]